MRGNDYDGTLVAVEGIDGAGKSTLVEALDDIDFDAEVVTTKEPTAFRTGEWVYESLSDESASAVEDFMLFCADRRRHVDWIEDQLEKGKVVITDRYADSTRAYQTHRVADETGMSYDEARYWMGVIFEPWNLEPDLVLYIDIPVDVAVDRCDMDDKYEKRENLEKVKKAYDEMFSNCDPSCRVIDGTMAKIAVTQAASNAIRGKIHGEDDTDSAVGADGRGRTYADAVGSREGDGST